MKIIKTIDLWTEQFENNLECFNGAFIDGLENNDTPFDSYKVIKNCNCIITTNCPNLNISNKHNAIIFYKNGLPVRLMVINKSTDVDKYIEVALNQDFNNQILSEIYRKLEIQRVDINLREKPINNQSDHKKEIDVASCDRPALLENMLEGSYTQNDTGFGKSNNDNDFFFITNINITYKLCVDDEYYIIDHNSAFTNKSMTRIIPLQDNSLLDVNEICNRFSSSNNYIK